MSPQRRTALVSVAAAAAAVVLKLTVGLATHSLGLVSEAVHSGTDLVAALLPSSRSASRRGRPTSRTSTGTARPSTSPRSPRRRSSSLASVFIVVRALERLAGHGARTVNATWYAFASSAS